jgi:hypothetical protein
MEAGLLNAPKVRPKNKTLLGFSQFFFQVLDSVG